MDIAKHTYIGCWNPYTFDRFSIRRYLAEFYQLTLWFRTHDLRWRASMGRSIDESIQHSAIMYEPTKIGKGDRFFVLCTGSPNPNQNGLIYSGFYETNTWESFMQRHMNEEKQYFNLIKFSRDVLLHPSYPHKFTAQYLQHRFPDYQWDGDDRGFVLSEEDALALEQEWYDFFSERDKDFLPDGPLYCQSPDGFRSMYEWTDEHGNIEHGRARTYLKTLEIQKDLTFRTLF